MTMIVSIQKALFKLLDKKFGVKVYNHVPENARFPYIRIADFDSAKVIQCPPVFENIVSVEVFTDDLTSVGCTTLMESISDEITNKFPKIKSTLVMAKKINQESVRQVKSGLWHGTISLELLTSYEH